MRPDTTGNRKKAREWKETRTVECVNPLTTLQKVEVECSYSHGGMIDDPRFPILEIASGKIS